MSDVLQPIEPNIQAFLMLFYPQYFVEGGPHYVDPVVMQTLNIIAAEARPWCLSEGEQDLAQAFYLAYLISVRQETSSGQKFATSSGPVVMEKEGDIQVQYADLTKTPSGATSGRPPSDAWDAWNRLYMRCGQAAILTRFGDPCRVTSKSLTRTLVTRALSLI